MRNIEYKAELQDFRLARSIAEALGARHVGTLDQIDTYYRIADGRLKKRETEGEETEWILYHRPDKSGTKLSEFTIYSEEEAIARYGAAPMPVWVIVKKRRELYILENIRIHLDKVDNLGQFLEFEALIRPCHAEPDCEAAIKRLRARFMHALGEPISQSYSDLLATE
jgi:adenylate cyclase, class 2